VFITLYFKISKYLKVKQVKNGLKVMNVNKRIFTKSEILGMYKIFKILEKNEKI